MTVKELIEELQKYPEDMEVVISDNSGVNGFFDYESVDFTREQDGKDASVRGYGKADQSFVVIN